MGLIRAVSHFSSTVSTIVKQNWRSEGCLLVVSFTGFLCSGESERFCSVEPARWVTLRAKGACSSMDGVEIFARVPQQHGNPYCG
jgi:hypothetical protein